MTYCEAWHTGPGGASVVPSTDNYELKKLLGSDGAQPQPPYPAYIVLVGEKPVDMLAADQVCPACLAALEAQYHHPTSTVATPLSEERLAEIREMLAETEAARESLHGLMGPRDRPRAPALQACRDLLTHIDWQREQEAKAQEQIERLSERNGALLDIVRQVAEADNSDSGVCYQLCRVRWYGGETDAEEMEMRHDAPCVVEQARAALAPGASEAGEAETTGTEATAAAGEATPGPTPGPVFDIRDYGAVGGDVAADTAAYRAAVAAAGAAGGGTIQLHEGNVIDFSLDVSLGREGREGREEHAGRDDREPLRDAYGMPRLPTYSDYGAVGDGVHDDTAAIQAAIDGAKWPDTPHTTGGGMPMGPEMRLRPDMTLYGANEPTQPEPTQPEPTQPEPTQPARVPVQFLGDIIIGNATYPDDAVWEPWVVFEELLFTHTGMTIFTGRGYPDGSGWVGVEVWRDEPPRWFRREAMREAMEEPPTS